jgi:hypothetical protein
LTKPLVFGIVMILVMTVFSLAQDEKPTSAQPLPSGQQMDHREPARGTYRLEYTITETEDGKKLNARTYTIMCEDRGSSTRGSLHVGSRVPIAVSQDSGKTQFQYLDIGMHFDVRLDMTVSGELSLDTSMDLSSIPDGGQSVKASGNPVMRHFRIDTVNALPIGTPVVIATADDVATHRQFQVQVIATNIR